MNLRPPDSPQRFNPLDLTSLVDVVFILIIFFLTTSSLIDVLRADIDLPLESGEEQSADKPSSLIVNVDRRGRYIVENATVDLDVLTGMISAEIRKSGSPTGLDLLVRPDRDGSLAPINQLAATLVELGCSSWRLATEVPPPAAGDAP